MIFNIILFMVYIKALAANIFLTNTIQNLGKYLYQKKRQALHRPFNKLNIFSFSWEIIYTKLLFKILYS